MQQQDEDLAEKLINQETKVLEQQTKQINATEAKQKE